MYQNLLKYTYLCQEPKIPKPSYCLRFFFLSGLSGTSFTGYPLPDVAAGINLKNQVLPIIMVVFGCFWNHLFAPFRVKFSRRTCLAKKAQQDETSASECQAVLRLTALRIRYTCFILQFLWLHFKKNYLIGEFRVIDRSVWKSRVHPSSPSQTGWGQV